MGYGILSVIIGIILGLSGGLYWWLADDADDTITTTTVASVAAVANNLTAAPSKAKVKADTNELVSSVITPIYYTLLAAFYSLVSFF